MPAFKTISSLVALLLFATGLLAQQATGDNTLLLRSGQKELLENASSFFEQPQQFRHAYENEVLFRYLQFYRLPGLAERNQLADYGIECLQYLSNRTYIAAIPYPIQLPKKLQYNIRAIEPIQSKDKIAPTLLKDLLFGKSKATTLTIQYFDTYPAEQVLSLLRKQQIVIKDHQPTIHAITIVSSIDQLTEIADWSFISDIEPTTTDVHPEDEFGHSHHRSNLLNSSWNSNMHFNGAGVSIAIGEDGFIGPHIDLKNRTNQADLVGSQIETHGEMVAGILAGAGNLNPINKGIADGAELYVLTAFDAVRQATFLNQEHGVVITNTAYSDGCNRGYTTFAQLADKQVHDFPSLIHVFSAGNAGIDDCEYGAGNGWGNITGGIKAGKNVLAVANLNMQGERVLSSSRGPANDGRIKPDISAFGEGQVGLAPNNNYQIGSGTSAASPVVSGILAQLYQAYREINYNQNPPSALLKTCLLNSADDLGNPGPDYSFGWGKINALRAFEIINSGNWITGVATQNSSEQFSVSVPEEVKQLRVMVYWHDKEGSPTSFKSLINDIDLTIKAPNGEVFLPWVLNASPNASVLDLPAIKGFDHLNNVEQVIIDNPQAGSYTFGISGHEIPIDSQNYYLVYQFDFDELTLTFPNGGESFSPGDNIIIHWDAFGINDPFILEYSINNGDTWESIETVDGHLRQSNWVVPETHSGQAIVRISRNNKTAASPNTFSIYPSPTGLAIEQVCPTYVQLNWEPVNDATHYIIYQLGETHMDSILVSVSPSASIEIRHPESIHWFAVSAVSATGASSRRSIAVSSGRGLVNCTPDSDLALIAITNPAANTISDCFDQPIPVSVNIKNTGSNLQGNFYIYYQYNNEPIVEESFLGTIPPEVTINYSFNTSIYNNAIGSHELKVWTGLFSDEAEYNDTLFFNFIVVPGSVKELPFFENFDLFESCSSQANCATNCQLQNDWRNADNLLHDKIDWRVYQGTTPSFGTGPNADQNTGVASGKYLYLEGASGCFKQLAVLNSPCINLSNTISPQLSFWYHMHGSDVGSLNIDLFDGLQWHSNISNTIVGEQGTQWQNAIVNLEAFSGQLVALRFRGTTGDGFLTDMAIDNIAVYETNTAPVADFTVDKAQSCTDQTIRFYDNSFNEALHWNWSFTPSTLSYLEGTNAESKNPVVQFHETGLYSISLSVTNSYGLSVEEKADYVHISNGMSLPFVQQFEGNFFPPLNWTLQNTDNDISWTPIAVVGKDGIDNNVVYMNNFSYNNSNEKDVLHSPVINLTEVNTPLLRFDYAYVSYSNNFSDQLSVALSTDCGNNFAYTLFEKSGDELATAPNQNRAWMPETTVDWNTAIIDLSDFLGQSISLRFTNTCQFGNNLYIDNVAVYEAGDFPETVFEISPPINTICVGESLDFLNTSIGNDISSYYWSFGNNNTPPMAETAGPHTVLFSEPGSQAITLIAGNELGTDVSTQLVQVIDEPVADFNLQTTSNGVQFFNNSIFGESYHWDFGDGQLSTEKNPVHSYGSYGSYEVELTVNNACGTNSFTQNIEVISSIYNPALPFELQVFPNPTDEGFFLESRNNVPIVLQLQVLSVAGKSCLQETLHLAAGLQRHQIDVSQLPAGLYLVYCQIGEQHFTRKLAVY